eukprot:scaffold32261_cov61-Phaeocystis_antarctica.AAC.3
MGLQAAAPAPPSHDRPPCAACRGAARPPGACRPSRGRRGAAPPPTAVPARVARAASAAARWRVPRGCRGACRLECRPECLPECRPDQRSGSGCSESPQASGGTRPTGAAPATRAPAPAPRVRAAAAWAQGWPSAARAGAGRVASRALYERVRYASASQQRAGGWEARPCELTPATPCPAASPRQTATGGRPTGSSSALVLGSGGIGSRSVLGFACWCRNGEEKLCTTTAAATGVPLAGKTSSTFFSASA